jgi:DNA recombination protein RmuC
MLTNILLSVVIVLILVLIVLVLRRGRINPSDFENSVSTAWIKIGLDKKIGEIQAFSQDIRNDFRSLETMLRVPSERGAFGEIALENILSDQLPKDMFGIREKIFDGKTPDAHILSTAGIICIDSKFPLDNFRKIVEVNEDEKPAYKKQFIKDVQGHLEKILQDYVHPESGSAPFAFAFIPSESVYYFLTTDAYDMLMNYARKGVQVVSPLTLAHKVELIRAGVHAKKLSEEAERVMNQIIRLSHLFNNVDKDWKIFYETHLRQASKKAEDLDEDYKMLRAEFDRIKNFAEEKDEENSSPREPKNEI